MKDAIKQIITRLAKRDYVSFVEINNALEAGGIGYAGDKDILSDVDRNIIIWADVSDDYAAAVTELFSEGKILLEPAHVLTYLCDGGMLQLPLAQRLPRGGYKTPHWLPTCIRPQRNSLAA